MSNFAPEHAGKPDHQGQIAVAAGGVPDAFDYHKPVLVAEILEAFAPTAGRLILDGTLGGGGHSRALLAKGAKIIGLDRDGGSIGYCIQHLVVYDGDTVRLVRANFREFGRALTTLKINKVDGILLDLGVSSAQLDHAERGFSFQKAGPLDMRMDQSSSETAADIVNGASQDELQRIFQLYGEESAAGKVAFAIVKKRQESPFEDTLSLARLVETVIPKYGPRHPATKVFQALRVAVNDEIGALKEALEGAAQWLNPGGRLAVITFHSLEDRLVKNFAREASAATIDRPEWPQPRPNPRHHFRMVQRRAIQASETEQRGNPRARSAKLRVLEKTSPSE